MGLGTGLRLTLWGAAIVTRSWVHLQSRVAVMPAQPTCGEHNVLVE